MTAPLGFAHRGARADAPENTLAAFALALRLGATGLESDVWLTVDGVPVLHHGAAVRLDRPARDRSAWDGSPQERGVRDRSPQERGVRDRIPRDRTWRNRTWRATPIGTVRAADLPVWLPSLADLLSGCGTAYDLSLDLPDRPDLPDRTAAAAVLAVARDAGMDLSRLWLCGRGLAPLDWRLLDPGVRLVSDTRRRHLARGWPAHLSRLADGGVAAVNLRRRGWTAARVQQVHAAGLLAFGWDAQTPAALTQLLGWGCDAVYSDHVPAMTAALGRHRISGDPGHPAGPTKM